MDKGEKIPSKIISAVQKEKDWLHYPCLVYENYKKKINEKKLKQVGIIVIKLKLTSSLETS